MYAERVVRFASGNRKEGGHGKRGFRMSNYLVAMEAAWLVRDVNGVDDAIGVAVSEAGKRLNAADMQYVEVEVGATGCPACGEPFDSAFIAAETALVGLALEMEVFNADGEEHAERIAKSEVGGALKDVPLDVVEIFEETDEEEAA
ncbi:hypothetical protein Halru_1535 [Halovivax ruber XH-70]|uniref:UPF0212 protein Halru_1535 n=2 Tax=Halovivax ruber TaxID=387341 RepID=L0IBE7_HALRX|nr:hypothetical protein Halru_1535 [Halovivax ruber XH-70]